MCSCHCSNPIADATHHCSALYKSRCNRWATNSTLRFRLGAGKYWPTAFSSTKRTLNLSPTGHGSPLVSASRAGASSCSFKETMNICSILWNNYKLNPSIYFEKVRGPQNKGFVFVFLENCAY